MPHDYYIILGIGKGANLNQIKKAYRKSAKKYHHDTTQSETDHQKFLELKEAYETLVDEKKRKNYDRQLAKQPSRIAVRSTMASAIKRARFFDEKDRFSSFVDEFFEGYLPGFFTKERRRPTQKDIYLEIVLSETEARNGGLFPITLPVRQACPQCGSASGWIDRFCPVCSGRGWVETERQFSLSISPNTSHGTSVRVSMDDIGLKGVDLHLLIRIDSYMS